MNPFFKAVASMAMISCTLCAMTACNKTPPTPTPKIADTGRPETRSIEAADAIGYNGKEIRKKLDTALNAQDKASQRTAQAGDEQLGQADQAAQ